MRALSGLCAVLWGCATTGIPPSPKQGGPTWRAVTTEHFAVYTDLGRDRAVAAAGDLEFLRTALAQSLAPGWAGPPGQIPVVVLAGDGHFGAYYGKDIGGFFTDVFMAPLIVMDGEELDAQQTIVKHELTHYLLDAYVPTARQPRWLAEGLASYFETVETDRRASRVTIGKTRDELVIFALARYRPERVMGSFDVAKLQAETQAMFYAESWLKVHYLLNHRRPGLARFLDELRRGESEAAAWSTAFPDLPIGDLDKLMRDYARDGKYRVSTIRMETPAPQVNQRELADADVHAWRALLHALRPSAHGAGGATADQRARASALGEAKEALRGDPGLPLALGVRQLLDDPLTLEEARAATEKHADDWMAWVILADKLSAAGDNKGMWTALREAVRLSLANPAIHLQQTMQEKLRPASSQPSG